jgi:poly [ADP-ribose] polymerase
VKTTKHVYLLNESILKLMERIFDEQCINDALNDLNYDSKRCPLLDLNKNTISQGYLILQELSTLIENAPSAQSQQVTVRQV